MTRAVIAFVRLGRPQFLLGGVVMHALGVSAALWEGARLDVPVLLWTQATITAGQLMVHYGNDYFDLEADRANSARTSWSGGSRVLPAELLPARVALLASAIFGSLGLLSAAVLGFLVRPLPLTVPLLVLALAASWSYSGPPLRLQGRGWGPPAGALVVGILTPLLGYYVQAGDLRAAPLLALLPVASLQAAMLVAVDLPDAAGDARAGKRTLVVRLGAGRSRRLYRALIGATYATLPVIVVLGVPWPVAAAAALTAPLAAWLARPASRLLASTHDWDGPVFLTIALLMATAVLESAAYVWLALR